MVHRALLFALLIGGLIGGALDLLFAISFAAYNGLAPGRLLQIVASGLLGQAAFDGGAAAMVLGIACHFGLSILWAALFAAVAWCWPALTRRPAFASICFGLLVFLGMRLIVLPLSAYPYPISFKPLATTLDLLSHVILFATPIVVFVGRALRARQPMRPE